MFLEQPRRRSSRQWGVYRSEERSSLSTAVNPRFLDDPVVGLASYPSTAMSWRLPRPWHDGALASVSTMSPPRRRWPVDDLHVTPRTPQCPRITQWCDTRLDVEECSPLLENSQLTGVHEAGDVLVIQLASIRTMDQTITSSEHPLASEPNTRPSRSKRVINTFSLGRSTITVAAASNLNLKIVTPTERILKIG